MKAVYSPFCTTLNFSGEAASFFYSSHITPLHAHNTLQLVFDLNNKFLFRTAYNDWQKFSGLLIKHKVAHQLDTNNSLQLIIYIDPTSQIAQKLVNTYLCERDFCDINIQFSPLEETLIHKNLINPDERTSQLLTGLIFDRFDNSNSRIFDKRISHVLQLIKETPPANLSIDQLASKVFISPSRLRMQFRKVLDISLHQYIIRQRILTAITGIINGLSVQEAAYISGFNDGSHLNKLMQKVFAINPSMFLKENRNFLVVRDTNSFELKTELAVM